MNTTRRFRFLMILGLAVFALVLTLQLTSFGAGATRDMTVHSAASESDTGSAPILSGRSHVGDQSASAPRTVMSSQSPVGLPKQSVHSVHVAVRTGIGQAVPGSLVSLLDSNGRSVVPPQTTDDLGRTTFSFPTNRCDVCEVQATKGGLRSANTAIRLGTDQRGTFAYAEVKLLRETVHHGIVLDPSGSAVPDATIRVLTGIQLVSVATSDAHGCYIVDAPESGTYLVLVRKPDLGTAWCQPEFSSADGEQVRLTLSGPGRISGTVVDDANQPLANTQVIGIRQDLVLPTKNGRTTAFGLFKTALLAERDTGILAFNVRSGPDGSFEVGGLAHGSFRLFQSMRAVWYAGVGPYEGTAVQVHWPRPFEIAVSVVDGQGNTLRPDFLSLGKVSENGSVTVFETRAGYAKNQDHTVFKVYAPSTVVVSATQGVLTGTERLVMVDSRQRQTVRIRLRPQ